MKPNQMRFTQTHARLQDSELCQFSPTTLANAPQNTCTKAAYHKPHLASLGSLHQIVRGASSKGCDCAGELDLTAFPF